MKKPRKAPYNKSKKLFKATANKTHIKNMPYRIQPTRGGIRL